MHADYDTPQGRKQGHEMRVEWNRDHAIGTPVMLADAVGELYKTRTRSMAWNRSDGAPVVSVEGRTGGHDLGLISTTDPEVIAPIRKALGALRDRLDRPDDVSDFDDQNDPVLLKAAFESLDKLAGMDDWPPGC